MASRRTRERARWKARSRSPNPAVAGVLSRVVDRAFAPIALGTNGSRLVITNLDCGVIVLEVPMAYWLSGWAGDHAGNVIGREPNRLLITVTVDDGSLLPAGLFQKGDLDGTPWYWKCWVECLTPNARDAIATHVDFVGDAFSITVAEWDWGQGKDPWAPGVHLFSVRMADQWGDSGTFATAVIADGLTRFDPKRVQALGPAIWQTFRDRKRAAAYEAGHRAYRARPTLEPRFSEL
jgi:hypothetical protein